MSVFRLPAFCQKTWDDVLALANRHAHLAARQVQVDLAIHYPQSSSMVTRGFELLRIQNIGKRECAMDVFKIDPTLKVPLVADQVVRKTLQHLNAQRIPGIFFSPYGRKLDPRLVRNVQIKMDGNGIVTIGKRPVKVDFPSCALTRGDGCPFSSQTIVRAVEEDGIVYFFDDESVQQQSNTPGTTLSVDTKVQDTFGAFVMRLSSLNDAQRTRFEQLLRTMDP